MHILLLYFQERTASTVYDHIESFRVYSKHWIDLYNTLDGFITQEELDQYDAVIIHYNLNIFVDHRCPPWLRILLRHTPAKKIIFIQDEYRNIDEVVQILDYIKADLLFTCVPEEEIEKVYPALKLPNLKKVNTLTGFVPENLLRYVRPTYAERSLDVVYRARKLSAWYGRLAQEKWMIADKFSEDAPRFDLKTNISSQEKDRIYGGQWIDFLRHAKSALGTESGASVFDFTGDIQKSVEQYEQEFPEASFAEIEEKFFKGLDGKIRLNQISPRAFECAALGTLMILYEGDYSGILVPWRHYLPLKKDHSNMKEIVAVLRNPQQWQDITDRAYAEIAQNPKYSYKHFIQQFDQHVQNLFDPPLPAQQAKILSITPKAYLKHVSKADYIQQEIHSYSYMTSVLVRLVLFVLKNLPFIIRHPLEKFLRAFKYHVRSSIVLLKDLLQNNDYKHLRFFWRNDFYQEYVIIFSIRDYLQTAQKIFGTLPICMNKPIAQKLEINISPSLKTKDLGHKNFLETIQSVVVIFENSCGIPSNLRNKQYCIKYKTLLQYIVDI